MTRAEKAVAQIDCSLVSLRAFREAARLESFTLAAKRIAVTQSAISHHVKLLEKQLNVKLFRRNGRQLALTNEGRMLYQAVESAFTPLAQAIERIHAGAARRRIVLGVLASFATKWLVPRLGRFYRDNPDIELVVRSVNHTIDIERDNVDLAVTTLAAPPAAADLCCALMWRERLFAVCTPEYATQNTVCAPKDLARLILLHDETEIAAERGFDWLSWLRHFKLESLMLSASSQYFSQSDLTLQAAMAGHGVALTRTSIAATDIKNGRLVNPFIKHSVATQSACYLCGSKAGWDKPSVSVLRDWLLAEAEADRELYRNTKSPNHP